MEARPIAENLFVAAPVPRLFGGRDSESGRLVFPWVESSGFEKIELPTSGVLWSYTAQRIAPKSPPFRGIHDFTPFLLGYVELAGACIVQTRLVHTSIEHLRVGLPMELTTTILWTDCEGAPTMIYAFRPMPAVQL